MFDLFRAIAMGLAPEIGRTELPNGLIVSTVDSFDCGPETAIIHAKGTSPVERYGTAKKAQKGHNRWCDKARGMKTGDKIVQIGYPGMVEDERVEIELPQ